MYYICIIYVLYMYYICTIYVLYMYYICIIYVLCMYYICIMYVLYMYYICIIYVLYMYYICIMYVLYMYYICISCYPHYTQILPWTSTFFFLWILENCARLQEQLERRKTSAHPCWCLTPARLGRNAPCWLGPVGNTWGDWKGLEVISASMMLNESRANSLLVTLNILKLEQTASTPWTPWHAASNGLVPNVFAKTILPQDRSHGMFGSKFRTLRFFLMEKIIAFSLDRKSWDILCLWSNPCFFIKLPINLGIPILSHVSQPLIPEPYFLVPSWISKSPWKSPVFLDKLWETTQIWWIDPFLPSHSLNLREGRQGSTDPCLCAAQCGAAHGTLWGQRGLSGRQKTPHCRLEGNILTGFTMDFPWIPWNHRASGFFVFPSTNP